MFGREKRKPGGLFHPIGQPLTYTHPSIHPPNHPQTHPNTVRRLQAAAPGTSVKDARARISGLATEKVFGDDKAFVQWVETR